MRPLLLFSVPFSFLCLLFLLLLFTLWLIASRARNAYAQIVVCSNEPVVIVQELWTWKLIGSKWRTTIGSSQWRTTSPCWCWSICASKIIILFEYNNCIIIRERKRVLWNHRMMMLQMVLINIIWNLFRFSFGRFFFFRINTRLCWCCCISEVCLLIFIFLIIHSLFDF